MIKKILSKIKNLISKIKRPNWIVENWRDVAFTHYSSYAFYLTLLFLIVPEVLFFVGVETNPYMWWSWALAAALFGFFGKFYVQGQKGKWWRRAVIYIAVGVGIGFSIPAVAEARALEPRDRVDYITPPSTEFIEMAVPFIAEFEGLELCAYQDIVGVWTIGFGHTTLFKYNPHLKDKSFCITEETAADLLLDEVVEYRGGLHGYFSAETRRYRLPVARDVAYTSLAYNVGNRGAGRSTAVRRLNAGNVRGGCQALTWWNKAGGRVVRGLVRRRGAEYALCMRGV